jgi:hypothetical protein
VTSSTQRSKFTKVKDRMDAVQQLEDEQEQTSTDDDEATAPVNNHITFFSQFENLNYYRIIVRINYNSLISFLLHQSMIILKHH